MPESLENSLDDLFSEGGLFEEEALAETGRTSRATPEDWIEPDAVALSPDDPPIVGTGQAPPDLHDPSEVTFEEV